MTDEKADVIPFGKYKGLTPEEVQAADPRYGEWISAQSWFRERFPTLLAKLMHGSEDHDTPEHNALQALFLCETFARRVVIACVPDGPKCARARASIWHYHDAEYRNCTGGMQCEELSAARANGVATLDVKPARFEWRGIDVTIEASFRHTAFEAPDSRHSNGHYGVLVALELKTAIGDDYPAVIRQVEAARARCRGLVMQMAVFAERFSASGVTREQMGQMMERSDIRLIWRDELPG